MDISTRDERSKKIDQVLLINLEYRKDRLEYFLKNVYAKSNIISTYYHRYDAIDGKKLSDDEIYSIVSVKGKEYMLSNHKSKGLYLTHGAIGLALTYKQIIDNYSTDTLILEDDIDIINNFDNELLQCLSALPDDWDILYLGWCDSKHLNVSKVNEYINLLSGQINGTHSWIINPKSKYKLLKLFPLTYQIDTEIYLRSDIKKYATYKKLTIRKNMGSDIQ